MNNVVAVPATLSSVVPMTNQSRSAGIDVLRGLSVLAVILLHINIRIPFAQSTMGAVLPRTANLVLFWSGYYGVVTFFVISGFLITTISLKRWQSLPRIPIGQFYLLRFARIGPCLLLVLALLSVMHIAGVKGFVIDPAQSSLPQALWYALTFRINVLEVEVGALPACWGVLWTLSIEEVFYLAFPLICRLARSERVMVPVLIAVTIAGSIARVVGPHDSDPQDHTYLCCMDGIAIGCLAALFAYRVSLSPFRLRILFVVGLAAAAFVEVLRGLAFDWGLVSTGLYVTLLEVGIALMLVGIQGGMGERLSGRGTAWLQSFGRSSYEVYLTHSFVVVLLTQLFRALGFGSQMIEIWYLIVLVVSAMLGYWLARLYSNPLNEYLRAAGSRLH